MQLLMQLQTKENQGKRQKPNTLSFTSSVATQTLVDVKFKELRARLDNTDNGRYVAVNDNGPL
jgi:hypothetical protein